MVNLTLPQKTFSFNPPPGHLVCNLTVSPFPRSLTKIKLFVWKIHGKPPTTKKTPASQTLRKHWLLKDAWCILERQDVPSCPGWPPGQMEGIWPIIYVYFTVRSPSVDGYIYIYIYEWSYTLIVRILKRCKVPRLIICFKKIQLVFVVV